MISKSPKRILTKKLEEPITPGGVKFVEKLREFSEKCDIIHLSVSLEAMNSNDCPGVGAKQKQGLFSEEMIEIMFQSGVNKKIASVDISGYCPGSEDYRTGHLLCNMFYYFVMGFTRR